MSFLYNTFKNAPAIGKKITQVFSKRQPTITGMKSTSGKTDTNQYLLKKAIKDVKTKTEKLREATKKGDK